MIYHRYSIFVINLYTKRRKWSSNVYRKEMRSMVSKFNKKGVFHLTYVDVELKAFIPFPKSVQLISILDFLGGYIRFVGSLKWQGIFLSLLKNARQNCDVRLPYKKTTIFLFRSLLRVYCLYAEKTKENKLTSCSQ